MSDLTLLSPLRLVSAACLNSDLNRFDNYVYFTSLVFFGICALVWISYYIRVCMLKKADDTTNEQRDENEPPPKTRDELYSEHMGAFILVTFLAYPNLSKIQFESLDCSTEFDGRKYLR